MIKAQNFKGYIYFLLYSIMLTNFSINGDTKYAARTPSEWEQWGFSLLFNGIFLAGGGIFVILLARLLK